MYLNKEDIEEISNGITKKKSLPISFFSKYGKDPLIVDWKVNE